MLPLACAAAALLAASPALAASAGPYPHSASPPTTLRVYTGQGLAPGDEVTLETLGGGLARERPQLYRVAGAVNSTSDAYSLWLAELVAHFGVTADAQYLSSPPKLLASFKSQITGYVKHSMSDGSVNAALTFIAGQKASELLVAASTPAMLALLKSWSTPLVQDCTGMSELQAYKLRGAGAFDGKIISFQIASQFSNLAEYAVFARAPTIGWECTAKPKGAPDNWQDECVVRAACPPFAPHSPAPPDTAKPHALPTEEAPERRPRRGAGRQRLRSSAPRRQGCPRLGPGVGLRRRARREGI